MANAESGLIVVGIGASAGGLQSLQEFFGAIRPDCGLAFVIIQHLAPAHESYMADILGKYVGQQYLDNSGNSNRILPSYGTCNLLFRYSVHLRPFRQIIASLQLNNIFNTMYSSNGYVWYVYTSGGAQYADNRYFPQAGFNVRGGLTLQW